MNKTIPTLLIASLMSIPAFGTIGASQIKDGRSFVIALASSPNIANYMRGKSVASPDLLIEVLTFVEEMDSRQIGLNEKATELLELADEISGHVPEVDSVTREKLRPIMNSLLLQYPVRSKYTILQKIMDRYWLWSPDHIEFLAGKVRNDSSHLISTQLLWVMEQATKDQRRALFMAVPLRKPNIQIRWFLYALALKYGYPVETRDVRRLLARVNPEKLRPAPMEMQLDGRKLPSTATLYDETKAVVERQSGKIDCIDLLLANMDEE